MNVCVGNGGGAGRGKIGEEMGNGWRGVCCVVGRGMNRDRCVGARRMGVEVLRRMDGSMTM